MSGGRINSKKTEEDLNRMVRAEGLVMQQKALLVPLVKELQDRANDIRQKIQEDEVLVDSVPLVSIGTMLHKNADKNIDELISDFETKVKLFQNADIYKTVTDPTKRWHEDYIAFNALLGKILNGLNLQNNTQQLSDENLTAATGTSSTAKLMGGLTPTSSSSSPTSPLSKAGNEYVSARAVRAGATEYGAIPPMPATDKKTTHTAITPAATAAPITPEQQELEFERKILLDIILKKQITNNDAEAPERVKDFRERIFAAINTDQPAEKVDEIIRGFEGVTTREFQLTVASLCENQAKILDLKKGHSSRSVSSSDDDDYPDDAMSSSDSDHIETPSAVVKKSSPPPIVKIDEREQLQAQFQENIIKLTKFRNSLQTQIASSRIFGYTPNHAYKTQLLKKIDQRIHLLTVMPYSQPLINQLPDLAKTIGKGILNPKALHKEKYGDKEAMRELCKDKKTWEAVKFDFTCFAISELLKQGVANMQEQTKKYTPVQKTSDSELIPIKANQTVAEVYQEYKNTKKIHAVSDRSAPDAEIGDHNKKTTLPQLKEKAKDTEARVCTVGEMVYVQAKKNGALQSTVCEAPDTFSNRKIWDKVTANLFKSDSLESQDAREKYGIHRPDLISKDALDSIWKALHKQITLNPADTNTKKIEYIIANEFKRLGFKHAISNPNQTAAYLAKEFSDEYSANLQPKFTRAYRFASDNIIKLVISQVQLLLEANPNATIHVNNSPNAQYLDTLYLYAKSKGIPIQNHTDYVNFPIPSTKKLEAFESLLKDRKLELPNMTRAYSDLKEAEKQLTGDTPRTKP